MRIRIPFQTSVWLGAFMMIAGLAQSAHGSVIVTISQVGPDVVETGSGTLNLTALTTGSTQMAVVHLNPGTGLVLVGATGLTSATQYLFSYVGPANFGPGGQSLPGTGSGDFFGFGENLGSIIVASSYTSGSSLSGTDTFSNATFSSLGLTPGSYTWTWGSGGTADSLTLNVNSATPEPGSLSLFGFGMAGLAAFWKRSRARARVR